jgi:acetolactate synthase-1/2/3 large subunit
MGALDKLPGPETAIRYGIPTVVFILNDNGFGFIKWGQKMINLEDFELEYGNSGFSFFAASFGAAGFKIKEGDDLADFLGVAFSV